MTTENNTNTAAQTQQKKFARPGSMWNRGKQRPLTWWLNKKEAKKSEKDPFERLRNLNPTEAFNVEINGNSIGITFEKAEAKRWIKESKSVAGHIREAQYGDVRNVIKPVLTNGGQITKTINQVNYAVPNGI